VAKKPSSQLDPVANEGESASAISLWPEVWIGPVRVHDILRGEIIDELAASSDEPRMVSNVNAHAINLAMKDREFLDILNQAHVCFCDGFGVMVLAKLFGGGKLRHRTTMPGFFEEVAARLHAEGKKAFLLGDEPGVAEAYARKLEAQWPGVIAGTHHGFIFKDPAAESEALERLRASRADVVAVGMGMPMQEKWVLRHMHAVPPARYLSVGALFAWSTQNRRRGPSWAVDHGFEWLFRLLYEPQRMWRRYLVGLPEVVLRVALWSLRPRRPRHGQDAS